MDTGKHKNALINETSPYLLQHADNPVQWYPWSEEALQRAKEEDKPILLSIGYSACHWCHVMAHESFEDNETAAIMNKHFINIKVDREERPDLDKIYQMAQQLLTQRTGGWPLTMFLAPDDQTPFFGGTYFPRETRYGLPGFKDMILRVAEFYKKERDAINQQNQSMLETLKRISMTPVADSSLSLNEEPIITAIHQLQQHFDPVHGGFGGAPKFPHPTNIECLLHQYTKNHDNKLLKMIGITLDKMANGGVYDQIGGGFYRYSVDDHWEIPHFEKMLYDNGPLLSVYTRTWQITGNEYYKKIAKETADWVIRDMQSSDGGYYSTLDADSEGYEGKFYVWDKGEIQSLLNEKEYTVTEKYFGLDRPPNFEGHYHLHVENGITDDEDVLLQNAKQKLLTVRNKRVWPGRDEKILTSWNGLMIKGMATAAIAFEEDRYFKSAAQSLEFIRKVLWKDGRLLATCKDDKAHLNAYLDDYAFVIDAILTLLNYQWNKDWLEFAITLTDKMLDEYEDEQNGGFYFTSHDHEQLIQRNKPFMDDALPAGNGIAASVLLQLGHLLGEQRYLDAAERTLRVAWDSMTHFPSAHNALLTALEDYLCPARQIILRGDVTSLVEWRRKCREYSNPYTYLYAIPGDETKLPGLLTERKALSSPVAYICEGHVCLEPVTRLDFIAENLNNSRS